ncbi:MAG: hypothetical protein EB116_14660, partial [Betaproteobacteria bacterium]|nr:hypothetical protein [Betaproteobacteria bacterium]
MRVHLRGLGFARRYPGQQAVTPGLKSWLVLLLVTLLFGYSLKARAESLMASADTLDLVEVRLELAQHDADQQGIEPVSWFRPADSAAVLASDP